MAACGSRKLLSARLPSPCLAAPAPRPPPPPVPLPPARARRGAWRLRRRAAAPLRAAAAAAAAADAAPSAAERREPFDWRLALALAGASFEAYNGVADAPCLRQTSAGGTAVTYVDPAFVRTRLAGLLELEVVSAAGLRAADAGFLGLGASASDPYAVLAVGPSAARTAVAPDTCDPEWRETFYLFVADPARQRLSARVLDADAIGSDDLLGAAVRGLADLCGGQDGGAPAAEPRELELPLRAPDGAPGGTLRLRARFLPFGGGEDGDGSLVGAVAAARMGGPVLGSPAAPLLASPWRGLAAALLTAEAAADAAFDPLAFVDNPAAAGRGDTQAWVFWNARARAAAVAFRGTEQAQVADLLTDLAVLPAAWNPEGATATSAAARGIGAAAAAVAGLFGLGRGGGGGEGDTAKGAAGAADEDDTWVHSGMLEAYRSVSAEIFALLDALVADAAGGGTGPGADATEPWTIHFTGHSLGGALSTLAACEAAQRPWRTAAARPRLTNYTYGSPRVGSRAWAARFDALVPAAWRVANAKDAVSLVPRLVGYCHVGGLVRLSPGGVLEVEPAPGGVAEGGTAADVVGRLAGAALAGSAAPGGELAALLEAEREAMAALLDGSAIDEHLEPTYLENIRAALSRLAQAT